MNTRTNKYKNKQTNKADRGQPEQADESGRPPPSLGLKLEHPHMHLQVQNGRALRVVKSRWTIGESQESGEGGQGSDRLQAVVPPVVGS